MKRKKDKIDAESNSLFIKTRQFCVFSEDGVAVAQIRIDMPTEESRGIAGEYFRKLSQYQERYANIALADKARAEYAADAEPQKRFLFKKYRYTAKIDVTYQNDEYISVFTEAKLTRGAQVLCVGRRGVIFTAGGLMPPIEFGVRRLPADEVLLLNDAAAPCLRKYDGNGTYREMTVKKKRSG